MLPLLLALSLLGLGRCLDISGQVVLKLNATIPVGSKVSLDHGSKYAYIASSGHFNIPNVDEGRHILEGIVPGYYLESYLLNINETIHVQGYHPAKLPLPASVPSQPYPIVMRELFKEDYYTQAAGMNVLGMLKSPMVLMMLFSGVMMFFMPKMMDKMNSDPELAAEVAATRKRMQGMQNVDFVGSLSNALAGGDSASQASTPARESNKNNGAGKRRKR